MRFYCHFDCDAMRYHTIAIRLWCDAIRYDWYAMRCDDFNAMRCDAMRFDASCDAMWYGNSSNSGCTRSVFFYLSSLILFTHCFHKVRTRFTHHYAITLHMELLLVSETMRCEPTQFPNILHKYFEAMLVRYYSIARCDHDSITSHMNSSPKKTKNKNQIQSTLLLSHWDKGGWIEPT